MGSGKFSFLLREHSYLAVDALTGNPKFLNLTKNTFSESVVLRMMKKLDKSDFLQLSAVFGTR